MRSTRGDEPPAQRHTTENPMNTWKPTTPAELKAIAEAADQVKAQGFTFCPDSAYIADIGGFGEHTAFAFSYETLRHLFGHPAGEGRVSFNHNS
jgi:hypothetical protein